MTFSLSPYAGESGFTPDVSMELTYSAKTERARRSPKVALVYSDPLGLGLGAEEDAAVHFRVECLLGA